GLLAECGFNSSNEKWVRRFAGNINPDAFRLQVLTDGIDAAFPADAGSLVSSERRHVADRTIRVDPHRPCFQPLRHQDCPADAGRPNTCSETIDRSVRNPTGVLFIVKWNGGENRTKDLFIGDAHIRPHICEYRRFNKPAGATFWTSCRSATQAAHRSFFFCYANILEDFFILRPR